MKIRTKVNAGGIGLGNHNENLVRDCASALKVETELYGAARADEIRIRARFSDYAS